MDWNFEVYNSPSALLSAQLPIKRKVNKIILHYSAIPHPPLGKALRQIEAIHKNHTERGWSGIGYHIAVHPSGVLISCRPLKLVGAHCRGHNTGSVGVVMLTDREYLSTNPPLLQWVTVDLLKQLCTAFNIDRTQVFLHKQFNQTECPPITREFEEYLHKAGFTSIQRGGNNG